MQHRISRPLCWNAVVLLLLACATACSVTYGQTSANGARQPTLVEPGFTDRLLSGPRRFAVLNNFMKLDEKAMTQSFEDGIEFGQVEVARLRQRYETRPTVAASKNLAEFQVRLAHIYEFAGDHARARELIHDSLSILATLPESNDRRTSPVGDPQLALKTSLAMLNLYAGDYADAERQLRETRNVLTTAQQDVDDWARLGTRTYRRKQLSAILKRVNVWLGDLYFELGDYEKGASYYVLADDPIRNPLLLVWNIRLTPFAWRARLAESRGLEDEARTHYEEGLRKARKHDDQFAAEVLFDFGRFEYRLANYDVAEEYLEECIELYSSSDMQTHPDVSGAQSTLARVLTERGRFEKAERLFQEAHRGATNALLQNAVLQSERQQLSSARQVREQLDSYLTFVANTGRHNEACYNSVLDYKGAVLARQRAIRSVSGNPETRPTLEEYQSVTQRLAGLALNRANNLEVDSEQTQAAVKRLSRRKGELEATLAKASDVFRRDLEVVDVESVRRSLPPETALVDFLTYEHEIPPHLRTGEETSVLRVAAFVLTHDQPVKLVVLPNADELEPLIEQWRSTLAGHRQPGMANDVASKVRRRLWEPLEPLLDSASFILISPDRSLGTIPFGAFPGREAGSYLSEERTISTVPAARELPRLISRESAKRATRNVLLVGGVDYEQGAERVDEHAIVLASGELPSDDRIRQVPSSGRSGYAYLPGTATEINTIARIYRARGFAGDRLTVLSRQSGSETSFRDHAPDHAYLHLATHGFFAPPSIRSALSRNAVDTSVLELTTATEQQLSGYHPGLLSGIVLAGANQPVASVEDDGILTAEEVATLDLSGTKLCVLSACETGLGKVAGGEGLLGLQRAFQVSGVETTITSLWKVDDHATQTLMTLFYDNHWRSGMGKLTALREAQLTMLHQYDPSRRELVSRGATPLGKMPTESNNGRCPPRYWAAFVLSGDWR